MRIGQDTCPENTAMKKAIKSVLLLLFPPFKRLQKALDEKTMYWEEAVKRNRELENELGSLYKGNRDLMEELQILKTQIKSLADLHDDVVNRNWENDKREGMCLFPFTHMEITSNGDVYTCCPAWLKHGYSIGNIYKNKSFEEIWNSQNAKRLRYSVTEGNFEYCNKYCKWLSYDNESIIGPSPIISRGLGKYRFSGYHECNMEITPAVISLSCDMTCNLYCVPCRSHLRKSSKPEDDKLENMLETILKPALKDCNHLNMLGSGEFFFSIPLQKFCKTLTKQDYPTLKITIITNAQLLTREKWDEFENLKGMIGSLVVSVDAAEQQTYESLRRGGKWEKLQEALSLISEIRKNNEIEQFRLNFVVQKSNYRQIPDFVIMAKSKKADVVEFQRIYNLGTFTEEEFFEIDVMNPKNEYYEEAKGYIEEVLKEQDIIIEQNIL
jgi:radical SAM protein with 4Fe4S-binding SPASM domain